MGTTHEYRKPKFIPGQVVATPGAILAIDNQPEPGSERTLLASFIDRHTRGDWGDMCDEDKELNEKALEHGHRVMSVFNMDCESFPRIYVITEWDRSVTTVCLPEEY